MGALWDQEGALCGYRRSHVSHTRVNQHQRRYARPAMLPCSDALESTTWRSRAADSRSAVRASYGSIVPMCHHVKSTHLSWSCWRPRPGSAGRNRKFRYRYLTRPWSITRGSLQQMWTSSVAEKRKRRWGIPTSAACRHCGPRSAGGCKFLKRVSRDECEHGWRYSVVLVPACFKL